LRSMGVLLVGISLASK